MNIPSIYLLLYFIHMANVIINPVTKNTLFVVFCKIGQSAPTLLTREVLLRLNFAGNCIANHGPAPWKKYPHAGLIIINVNAPDYGRLFPTALFAYCG